MKVVVVDSSVAVTGAVLSAIAMAEAMRGRAEFEFVMPRGSLAIECVHGAGFRVHQLRTMELGRSVVRLLAYLPVLAVNAFRLRSLLRREGCHVLVANDYYNMLPAVTRLLGWRGGVITIIRLLPSVQNRILNGIWLRVAQYVSDRIVAVSLAVKMQAADHLQADVLYFPVGLGYLDLPYRDPPSLIKGEVRFLFLANYIRGKGQDVALKAFSRLVASSVDGYLVFAGGDMGLPKNRIYRSELEHTAGLLGLVNRVSFLGLQDDPKQLFGDCDVVLNFSDAESFSQTCAEAGLMGRPVIATRCGGPEELIEDGVTGILVARADVEAMATAMGRLAIDSDLRRQMGVLARQRMNQLLNARDFREKMTEILESIPCHNV